jgi:D-alanyl-D-alanine-carboxypeptidase/D-alanyl-D-alanine-endopeptidase
MKRFLLITMGVLFALLLAASAFIYFSVSNAIHLDEQMVYRDTVSIMRLDSQIIRADSMTSHIEMLLKKANVQGMGVSIINRNQLVYQHYFGMKNVKAGEIFVPGTIWYGASLSKPIFADVVLHLVDEKIINLDTPLYRYLKKPLHNYSTHLIQRLLGRDNIDYADLERDERYKKITARMCLSHSTGLPNWRWIEEDRKLKIKFEPGTRYSYSGEGLYFLQFVIEELTGENFESLAQGETLLPLNMSRSSYVWQRAYEGNYAVGHDYAGNSLGIRKTNSPNAAGSLSTTLEDYTKFFQAVLGQENDRYRQMITPEIKIIQTQQFGPGSWIDTQENDSIQLSYGLGFGVYESAYGRAFFKEGHDEGWQHYSVGIPSHGNALIMMSNSNQAEAIFKEMIEYTTGNKDTPWQWEGFVPGAMTNPK